MDDIILTVPDASYSDEISSYRREFLECGSSMDGTGFLRSMENPKEWLAQVKSLSLRETVPENLVQSTQFIAVRPSDGRIVGMIQLRHYFNEYLEKFGGHIGYSVRPAERRRGYASRMLADILPYCREIGLERVLITCLETNEASRRTILKNGGMFERTVFEPSENVNTERYWITL